MGTTRDRVIEKPVHLSKNADSSKQSVKPVVIVPTYNNGRTLLNVIQGISTYISDMIVVNDGSTDQTQHILESINYIESITLPINSGKGSALKAGFELARAQGYTHALTIDSDGQHLVEDIPVLLAKLYEDTDAIWVGDRSLPCEKSTRTPNKSRFGRKFGNFWFKFNTGISLHDTQSGFRVYPLKVLASIKTRGKRYEYEQEILVRAAWNDIPIKEIPIREYYQYENEKVSHFRPFRDFLRISGFNSRAAMTRIFVPKDVIQSPGITLKDKIIALLKYEIRSNTSPKRAAFSLSTGVFLGIFPIHMFQVLTLIGLSFLLKLNRPLGYLGVSISSPPFLPIIFLVTVAIGKFVLPSHMILLPLHKSWNLVAQYGVEFIVGSIILAPILAALTFGISYPLFIQYTKLRTLAKRKKKS